ncbi:MAG: class II aldolase/adducin family protein [Janthinobacterium lividum]
MDMTQTFDEAAVRQARIELAAACRWAARHDLQTGICNHFSMIVPGRPDLMLVNPEGYFWSEVTASNIVMADFNGNVLGSANTVELTAFNIHAPVHRLVPQATAVLHTHMPHATAICARKDGEIHPVYLSALSFHHGIAYDRGFDGSAAKTSEGERLAGLLSGRTVLMMQNHGPLVLGETMGEALLRLMYLEDTCRIQILAEAGGAPLEHVPQHLLEKASAKGAMFKNYGKVFMNGVVRKLSREEPDMLG